MGAGIRGMSMIHLHKQVKHQLSTVTRCGLLDNPYFWRTFEARNKGNRQLRFYEKDSVTEEGIYIKIQTNTYYQIIQLNPIGGSQ
jgi:hypothetical protein